MRSATLPRLAAPRRLALPVIAARAIRGRVVTTAGVPVAGARVVMREERADDVDDPIDEVVTGEDGRYAFSVDVEAGQLVVEAAGHASQRKDFDSASRVVDFRLFAGATIRGRVVRVDDRACPGAAVKLEAFDAFDEDKPPGSYARIVIADANGAFAFAGVPPGPQRITARGVGCATAVGTDLLVELGARLDDIRVIAEHGYTVRGIAVQRGTQRGVAGVELSIDLRRTAAAVTDRDGRFTIHGVAAGNYALDVGGNAVQQEPDGVVVIDRDRDDLRVEVDLGRTIRGRVEPPVVASIVVPQTPNGTSIWDAETESAPDGTFELRHVPIGKHVLHAYTRDGLAKDVAIDGDHDVSGVVVALAPIGTATLLAHVVDEDRQPVPFARFTILGDFVPGLSLRALHREVVADGQGALVIPNVVAGSQIWITPDDHVYAHTDQVHLVADGRDHELVVRRPGARVIRGLVKDANGPVASIRVVAYPTGRGPVGDAFTDAAGRFELTGLDPVEYELRANTARRDRFAKRIVSGSEFAVLELAAVHQLELRVTENGVRVRAFDFSCSYGGGTRSSSAGVLHGARLESTTPDPVTCQVHTRAGAAVASGTFGTTPALDLAIVTGFRITGRVVDEAGKPIEEPVMFRDERGFTHFAEADAQGRFALAHVLPGSGTLYVLGASTPLAELAVSGDRDLGTLTPRGTSRTP